MFIDQLHPNAEEIESGGRQPRIFTNACDINCRVIPLFEHWLNGNKISKHPGDQEDTNSADA